MNFRGLFHRPPPALTVKEAVNHRDRIVLLDVRDSSEVHQRGKAEGAVCIPLTVLGFRADNSHPDYDARLTQNATIAVYCARGKRSKLAVKILRRLGYTDVHDIGGFKNWVASGGPVSSD